MQAPLPAPQTRIPEIPSIPPLPVPKVESRVEEMIVSGSAYGPPPGPMFPGPPPGTVETERYPSAVSNPIRRVAEEPVSTFSIDVDTAAYANVRRFVQDGRRPPRDAVRVEELVNYFDYGYPRPASRAEPFATYVAVAPSPWSRDRQLLHIGLQGFELQGAERPPLNLVFLIDTSGSMTPEDRLPLAKKSLNLLIDQLRPQDRVAMVAYAGSAGAVLAPTGGREKLKMRCALEALHAGGSTAGGQGLALAYALARERFDPKAVNRVILVTDGDFNVGVADPAKLKDFVAEQRKTGVYLSVYGFGRGNYQDLMMQTLAQNGNGTAAYVDSLMEARKLLRTDFSRGLFPIADDVKIQVEFNPAQVVEYRLIGYETRLLNREDFNNDRVDAGEVGSGASVTALYEITPAGAAPSSDPLRYSAPKPSASATSELAFLKVRYKLPRAAESKLITRPIGPRDRYSSVEAAPEATRWAAAVAGYGQRLRGDPWLEDSFGWREIAGLAQRARGDDPMGERAEFVQLVRAASEAASVNEAGVAGGD
jgi:Ca-activated chloride channel family protein